jgi:hypothetical protein
MPHINSSLVVVLTLLVLACAPSSVQTSGGDVADTGEIAGGFGHVVQMSPSDPRAVATFDDQGTRPPRRVIMNELLVTATPGATREDIEALAEQCDGSLEGEAQDIRLWQIRFANPARDPAVLSAALDTCRANEFAEHCFPNAVLSDLAVYPDDGYAWDDQSDDCACAEAWGTPDIENQVWGLKAIEMPEAWDLSTGSSDIPIAVVDSGMLVDHRDFSGAGVLKFGSSWKNGHGTHVAGIIGARGDNGVDITGVNWHAPLWFYEVQGLWGDEPVNLEEIGGVPLSAVQTALVRVALDGARLVNLSFGTTWQDSNAGDKWCPADGEDTRGYAADEWQQWLDDERAQWRPVLENLKQSEVLVVAAAGNNSDRRREGCEVQAKWTGGPQALDSEYPDNVLLVVSVGDPRGVKTHYADWNDEWNTISSFSSTGGVAPLAAPGANILSLCPMGSLACPLSHTTYRSGTSMAAPFVTGLASLVWSLKPKLTVRQVKQILIDSARDAGPSVFRFEDPSFSQKDALPFHVVNARAALNLAKETEPDHPLDESCTDADGDGFGQRRADGSLPEACVNREVDCDDADPGVYPSATEICNGRDDNCNGHVDEEGVCVGVDVVEPDVEAEVIDPHSEVVEPFDVAQPDQHQPDPCGLTILADGQAVSMCGGGFEKCLNFFNGFTNCICNSIYSGSHDECIARLGGGFNSASCGHDGRTQADLIEEMSAWVSLTMFSNVSLQPDEHCNSVPEPEY